MKSKLQSIAALALMLIFGALCAVAGGNAPAIELAQKSYDFGTVKDTDPKVVCEFEFTNTGTAPLVIISAKSSCGCTRPSYPDAPIPPGGSGKITVKFNPKHQMGEIMKTVTVRTNAKKNKKITLRISGVVIPTE